MAPVNSWHFYDVNDVASEEYGINFRDKGILLERKKWEKYREKAPGLIAELEAAERIANEANEKYGTNIRLCLGEKPYLETSFDARDMSEDKKFYEIEKHARAMYDTWKLWNEWTTKVGREIYMKTTKRRLSKSEFMHDVILRLHDITQGVYVYGDRKLGIRWIVEGSSISKRNLFANRGAWLVKEAKDSIVIMSDNFDTINARTTEEYNLLQQRKTRKIVVEGIREGLKQTIISPELMERVVKQVGEKYMIRIHMRKDKPVIETAFRTGKLKPYGKLYEIERHAKALVEVWNRIKEITLSKDSD